MDELIEKIKAKRIELRDASEERTVAEAVRATACQRYQQLEKQYEDLMTEFYKATEPLLIAK